MTVGTSAQSAAEAELERAAAAVEREQVLNRLSRRRGLAYARAGADGRGPYLVTYEGRLIGQVSSESDSALLDWYAHPENGADPSGPFLTIRAAAASLPR
ncbi:hypothetical protein [Streptomyces sp. NPDC056069]|uniref:hypothetical protein n=1 Tax=unclassified Streptomyces TaxID=2593676 RepID=UPI0035DB2BF2